MIENERYHSFLNKTNNADLLLNLHLQSRL